MKLQCTSCKFELNLTIKSLPKNAKLYCPKCKNLLSPISTEVETLSNPTINPASNTVQPQQIPVVSPPSNYSQLPSNTIPVSPSPAPPAIPSIVKHINPQPNNLPSDSQIQLFNEDLKPELEISQSEEEILKKREELFSKPEQVWYDSSKPPPIQITSNEVPPPIPEGIPPPIPFNTPPPIPDSSVIQSSGYISASSSIQIDSSLVMPDLTSTKKAQIPLREIKEEKLELAAETPSTEKVIEQPTSTDIEKESGLDKSVKVETAERKDVILLSPQTYLHKKISITIPAVSLIVLALIAGFIYYQIVVSSSKTELIKDLKSTPALGAIPAINNTKQPDASGKDVAQINSNNSNANKSKIPLKAKKSALEHYKRGNQFFMESKYEQARDEYAMAIAADPAFGLAYRGLGTTYAKLGQPEQAVINYEKYIEISPNATDAEQVKNIIKQYYAK